jgi:hypothetical protein
MDLTRLCFRAWADSTQKWASSFWTTPTRKIPKILDAVLEFLQETYSAAVDAAPWDRATLDRRNEVAN